MLYFAAGIFGNVLGGNFALVGLPSVGASGAIFGTVGCLWVDLIAHWRFEHKPVTKVSSPRPSLFICLRNLQLLMLLFELVFGIALGFLPGTDNFAHIGGFLLGLLSAIALYPIICETKRRVTVVWIIRIIAVAGGFVLYFTLIHNFYTSDPYKGMCSISPPCWAFLTPDVACSWCRYLSCIPSSMNDHCRGSASNLNR